MNTTFRVKKMKTIISFLFAFAFSHQLSIAQTSSSKKQPGERLLFNGKDTKGWHTYLKSNVTPAWTVVNSTLQLNPKAEGQGDLLTDQEYENFELSLEWNISEGGNSGLIFGVHEDPAFHDTYDTGIEMQILDNKNAEDNKKANHLAGSLYDIKAPSKDVAKPAGQWNLVKLRKQNGHLTFSLNSVKIVETKILVFDSRIQNMA